MTFVRGFTLCLCAFILMLSGYGMGRKDASAITTPLAVTGAIGIGLVWVSLEEKSSRKS